ncbi:MAG: RNA methyltransferase [Lachnospiraceae bacterium]|nr:RNA methyltransferase [Lachnospiraceae bacterium]
MINSPNNSQVKHLVQLLKKAKLRKEEQSFIVEGRKMFLEAEGLRIKSYISESYLVQYPETLELLKDEPYEIVTDSIMQVISDTKTPQGIVTVVRMPEYSLTEVFEKEESRLIFLESLRDPGNLGTIVRTAEGAGIRGVILNKESVDIYNPKVVRSTMGAIFRMPVIYVDDFYGTLRQAKAAGFELYAAHLKGTEFYDDVEYAKKTGVLIGNESAGLSEQAAEEATKLVKIPMEGQVESLNAAIAATVFMYEIYRQWRKS